MSIKEKYDEYVKRHIFEPKFAIADIVWNDTKDICSGMVFKLSCDVVEEEDNLIFFYLNGYSDLEDMRCIGAEDFTIIGDSVEFFEKL